MLVLQKQIIFKRFNLPITIELDIGHHTRAKHIRDFPEVKEVFKRVGINQIEVAFKGIRFEINHTGIWEVHLGDFGDGDELLLIERIRISKERMMGKDLQQAWIFDEGY
jgi:hypothetical protein